MNMMQAVKLTGIRKIEIVEESIPEIINATDVLLKVDVVGICGSDVHYYTTGRIGNQIVEYPFTVGHEFSATIVDLGRSCLGFKTGDRVAIDPTIYCGTCEQCLKGRYNTCLHQKFLGCPGQNAGCSPGVPEIILPGRQIPHRKNRAPGKPGAFFHSL